MEHTHLCHDEDGQQVKTSQVRCSSCGNDWWVRWTTESQPICCCYCGIRFRFYTDPDGQDRSLNGRPIG